MSSIAERSDRPKRRIEAYATAAICLAFVLSCGTNAYRQDVGLLVIVYSLLALGMYLPLAICGSLSLAYNAYFAAGAYAIALAGPYGSGAMLLAVLVSVLVSAAIAALIGQITRQLTLFHLAAATLMFGVAAHTFLVHTDGITGGPAGIGAIPRFYVFGMEMGRASIIAAGAVIVWGAATMISRLRRSLLGVAMRTQREVPLAAQVCGVSVGSIRIVALSLGAGVASLGGVFLALMNQFVQPDSFQVSVIFTILFMPILGGISSPWGSVLGAFLVVTFTIGFDFFNFPGALTFGLMTLLVILLAPAGILGRLSDVWRVLKIRLTSGRAV